MQGLHWLGEPPQWSDDGTTLRIRTGAKKDFWCRTLQDNLGPEEFAALGLAEGAYVVDNGHFRYQLVEGDFCATTRVSGQYRDQYDQAGLMVRQDQGNWLKASVEVVHGTWADRYHYRGSAHLLGATLTTHGWSEWSVLPQFPENPEHVWIRVTREMKTFYVDFSLDGEQFTLIKMFSLPDAGELMVGRYATSPTGEGFDASFDCYSVVNR